MDYSSTREKLATNAVLLISSDISRMALGLLLILTIIKLGGLGIYGVYKALISFSSLLLVFVDLGLQNSLLKFLGEKDKKIQSKYLTAALVIRLLISHIIVFSLIFLDFRVISISSILGLRREYLIISSFFTVFSVLPLFKAYYTAQLSVNTYFKASLLGNVMILVLDILTLLAGLGVLGLLVSYLIGNMFSIFYLLLSAFRSGYRVYLPSLDDVLSLLSLGISTWLPSILKIIGRYSAELFIFTFAGAVQTGEYSVAFTVMTVSTIFLTPVAQLLIPNLSRYPEKERNKVIQEVITLNYLLLIPIAGIIFLLSDNIMKLVGATNGIILRILLLSVIFIPLMQGNSIIMIRKEEKRIILGRGALVNLTRLGLFFSLTPSLGGVGAALSYTTSELLRGPVEIYLIKRHGVRLNGFKLLLVLLLGMVPPLFVYRYGIVTLPFYVGLLYLTYRSILSNREKDLLKWIITTPFKVVLKYLLRYKNNFFTINNNI